MPNKNGPGPMDVDKALIQSWSPCHCCHQSRHLTCDCPHDIRTMTDEERLELFPKLLTLTESTEILSPSTDLERLTKEGLDEGLLAKELSKEHFGSCSG